MEDKEKKKKDSEENSQVKWNYDPAEGANPLPGTEPSTGSEDVPDLGKKS